MYCVSFVFIMLAEGSLASGLLATVISRLACDLLSENVGSLIPNLPSMGKSLVSGLPAMANKWAYCSFPSQSINARV